MKKKILIIDDSALMRRMICDIILSDGRYLVADIAKDGIEGLELLKKKTYDCVLLDVNMPRMTGLELLKELNKLDISAKVVMASTDTKEGAQTTLDALELGAMDFIHKPDNVQVMKAESFKENLLRIVEVVAESTYQSMKVARTRPLRREKPSIASIAAGVVLPRSPLEVKVPGKKIVAIASSTGGPRALQEVIPLIPKEIDAPVLVVQHMPAGFTKTLSERLDLASLASVKEAEEGDILQNGHIYIAPGGKHMQVHKNGDRHKIILTDEPPREGVKPCANYMYESLMNSGFNKIVCAVLTGMGADATKGIVSLGTKKKIHVIAQNESTCAVYGMPKSIVATGLVNDLVAIDQVAKEIIKNTGVR